MKVNPWRSPDPSQNFSFCSHFALFPLNPDLISGTSLSQEISGSVSHWFKIIKLFVRRSWSLSSALIQLETKQSCNKKHKQRACAKY